ncbi:alkaline shock response membrane anchor protein AmaP [Quadrisphaera sp. DSM 44207]|uniref:alkaline shock response membrane anchor protein AmaP n=1 Tax=Quadrisphaera sp. DSM 44207 TaxID=1881057 RepID=UPI00089086C3|nr:alkaline shock response membrane anchor protein AmaP [Quadrisphaera sp. DSM 44207]SDQ85525.1 hypothetical protein SAMN05428996_2907 [Quadrisphaera sp. DSM 44207]
MKRVNGLNRTLLALLALLLLAAGGLGLALGLGAFGARAAGGPVLWQPLRDLFSTQPWAWWALAAVCLLVALLALRWLAAQLRTDRTSRIDLTEDERDGVTTLHAGAVADAVEHEVSAVRGVAGASASLHGEGAHRLSLVVELSDRADLAAVRDHLEEQTVPHVRQALDDPDLPVDVQLRPAATRSASRNLR